MEPTTPIKLFYQGIVAEANLKGIGIEDGTITIYTDNPDVMVMVGSVNEPAADGGIKEAK